MKASRNRRINALPHEVWGLISTIEGLTSWYPGVVSAEYAGGPESGAGRRHRMERMLYMHDLQVEQEIVEWEPGHRITLAHRRETIDGSEVVGVSNFTTTVEVLPAAKTERASLSSTAGPPAWASPGCRASSSGAASWAASSSKCSRRSTSTSPANSNPVPSLGRGAPQTLCRTERGGDT